jgi:subtilisin family serine protease
MRTVPRRSTLALIAAVVAALAAPAVAAAEEGQIIVKYADGADAQERADARADADVAAAGSLPLERTEVVAPESGTTVAEAVADLERSPDVAYAEPDAPRSSLTTPPGDTAFAAQWSLQNTGQKIFDGSLRKWTIGAPGDDIDVVRAWESGITASDVTVGIVDSGADLAHPDLKPNLLSGGYDFVDHDTVPDDRNGHGTHVAGIIGAAGDNGVGVSGVAWKASLLPVRVLDKDGSGSTSTAAAGYTYAAMQGARVVNVSLGGDRPSQTEYTALRNARNTLFVVAAGNDGENVDTTDSYPCAYDLPNVLCVAATGGDDRLAGFSDYGATSVDIAAPGVDILSTYPTSFGNSSDYGAYQWLSGTSMAAPEVTGAAALVLGQDPDLSPWQLREKLMDSTHKVDALAGKVASGGRLDVAAALEVPAPTDATPDSSEIAPAARAVDTAPSTPAAPATPAPQPAPAVPSSPAPVRPAPTPTTTTTTTTTAPVAPAVDHTAPTLSLSLSTRGALTALLKGRLRVSTSVSERASVRVDVRLDARTAKKLHLKASKTGVRIATGRATATRAGKTNVTLKLTSAAKRALARVRSVKATLTATATDAAGNRGARSRTLTIKR